MSTTQPLTDSTLQRTGHAAYRAAQFSDQERITISGEAWMELMYSGRVNELNNHEHSQIVLRTIYDGDVRHVLRTDILRLHELSAPAIDLSGCVEGDRLRRRDGDVAEVAYLTNADGFVLRTAGINWISGADGIALCNEPDLDIIAILPRQAPNEDPTPTTVQALPERRPWSNPLAAPILAAFPTDPEADRQANADLAMAYDRAAEHDSIRQATQMGRQSLAKAVTEPVTNPLPDGVQDHPDDQDLPPEPSLIDHFAKSPVSITLFVAVLLGLLGLCLWKASGL